MKRRHGIFLLIVFTAALAVSSAGQQTADELYQAGIYAEEVEGNLAKAIETFKKVISAFPGNAAISAQAQLHIGMCYEKMGIAEAVKAYELVVQKYPGQAEAVAEARSRLAALRKEAPAGLTMSRLLPPEVYLECQTLSPDGMKVAGIDFSKGQNVAVYDLAGGKLQFITNYNWKELYTYVPIWSPNGKEIAYQGGRGGGPDEELWISSLAGTSRLLYKNPHGPIVPCDWLADGSAIVAFLENENKTYSLGLVSTREGTFRELYRSQRTSRQRNNPAFAIAGSADASPDGRLIAFSDGPPDGARDISVIAAGGGIPAVLAEHPADDKEPRWSPDGRHLVFLSNRHGSWALWGVAVRDGKPEGDPFMVLEGMQDTDLSFWTNRGLLSRTSAVIRDIYTLEIDPQSLEARGKPRILDFTPSGSNFRPQWSPDGKSLAFVPFQNPGERKFPSSIMVMPAEGGKARRFENPTGMWHWLPDSSGLWFFGQDEEKRPLYKLLQLASGQWKTVAIPGEKLPKPTTPSMALGGEGKTFFYAKMAMAGSEGGLYAYDLDSGQERVLFPTSPDERGYFAVNASRDHKRLAMGLGGRILIFDVDTGRVEHLAFKKENLMIPAWSPDGTHLVAAGRPTEDGDFNEIFIVSLADKQAKSLDVSRHFPKGMRIMFTLDWSPDGKTIAYDTMKIISETNLIQNLIPKK